METETEKLQNGCNKIYYKPNKTHPLYQQWS